MKKIEKSIQKLIDLEIEKEYNITDNYGNIRETTNIRKQVTKGCLDSFKYNNSNYRNDRNYFTNCVNEKIEEIKKFQGDFNLITNELFVKETLDFAVKTLKEKLKINN